MIMRTVYGYWLTGPEDPFLTNPLTAMANFSEAIASGVWLVDILPFVKYIPKWLPGTSFLSKSEQWKTIVMNTTYMPYEWSKEQILSGKSLEPNFSAPIFNQNNGVLEPDVEHTLIWSTSSVMRGGMDNNMSTIMTFILAMILYPDVQRKAQQEIFNVIGDSVLPSLSDKPFLPYVQSLVTEVYWWHPSMPLGFHYTDSTSFMIPDTLQIPYYTSVSCKEPSFPALSLHTPHLIPAHSNAAKVELLQQNTVLIAVLPYGAPSQAGATQS
ncbi:hypothetical protein D9757_007780 [Collybiopsis confluens]|uniref:Cytochrome P450 n=1 Tax=Collybiopsis confluens TaxID=2823264 RepID=A0A8H5HQ96_9AGAR|nr:hypothetical protein D9757_007780 [Collybiopsis confluens]